MDIYDYCIIGCGPLGIAILNKLKKFNIISLEKSDKCFNTVHKGLKDSPYASKLRVLRLDEEHYKNVDINKIPTIEEVLYFWNKFVEEKKLLKYIKFNYNVTEVKHKNNFIEIVTNNTTINCKKLIVATGDPNYDYPKDIPFNIINSNVKRHLTEWKHLKEKNIVIIGGGDTACCAMGKLKKYNNITLFTRNKNKCIKRIKMLINVYGQKDCREYENNINIIEYKNIDYIKNNIIYYNQKNIPFDECYIFFGYKNVIPFKLDNKINCFFPSKPPFNMYYAERIIGGDCLNGSGNIVKCPNNLRKFINSI
jgi:cation diffusion facilitator CzcD-associated flavoprotein CzcO